MALFHLRVSTFSRARGQSAVAAACYRAGERLTDERTGQRFDYRAKSRSVAAKWLTGWNGSRSSLWNKAERAETRKNATVAREVRVAIPRDLTPEQGEAVCRRFATSLSETFEVPVDAAIHCPGTKLKGNRNPHCHFLISTRRCKASLGEFGEKTREWDARDYAVDADLFRRDDATGRAVCGKGCVDQVRKMWEALANDALEQAGLEGRIDRRSLADQGIDRDPINVSGASLELESCGIRTAQVVEMKRRHQKNARKNRLRGAVEAAKRPVPNPSIEWDLQTEPQNGYRTEYDRRRQIEREIIRDRFRANILHSPDREQGDIQPRARGQPRLRR